MKRFVADRRSLVLATNVIELRLKRAKVASLAGPSARLTEDPDMASGERITLLAKPGCHLCDDARTVIERVAAELGVGWEERDITTSAQDMQEYWDKIPVTFVDGVQIDFWWVSEARLRAALR
jgi:glutaredoxin